MQRMYASSHMLHHLPGSKRNGPSGDQITERPSAPVPFAASATKRYSQEPQGALRLRVSLLGKDDRSSTNPLQGTVTTNFTYC